MMPNNGDWMSASLFELEPAEPLPRDILGEGTAVLGGFALEVEDELLSSLQGIVDQSPFRNMVTPGGFRMSVAMTNCGRFGWVTDRTGYRYDEIDPEVGRAWPDMPPVFRELAASAAGRSGWHVDAQYEP
jgi:alkylated DNA repair protein (DNA oxidative demethylase)